MGVFKKDDELNRLDSIVGNATIFDGTLTSKGSIHINGIVRGKILCEGTVMIGERGTVEAEVVADTVMLAGEVKGNITAKNKLEMKTSARLKGDIRTGSLIIAEGVLFEGKCQMITETRKVQEAAAPEQVKSGTTPVS